MSRRVTIALDAMGGDQGPDVVIPAALATLARDDSIILTLVGTDQVLQRAREEGAATYGDRLGFQSASEIVGMDELPADALRKKKDSSMRVAINLVKAGQADAAVSSGNTGALMATAKYVLKMLPGIDRPAILTAVPSLNGRTFMLDLGANLGCTAEQLFQFGIMGSVVAADLLEEPRPKVGLLNIGQEDIKGNETLREAGERLQNSSLNYVGFVEGDDIFSTDVDVVVTDGFTGNVALKTMEGLAQLIGTYLKDEFTSSTLRKLQGLVATPALDVIRARLDHRRYNGASLVGLTGIVIKSHGGADQLAFEQAIRTAAVESRKGLPVQISQLVERDLAAGA